VTPAPPTLICLFGAPAVGKMTVGQQLARLTGFHLFHAHQVIDLLTGSFAFGTPSFDRLVRAYKRLFFEEAAESGLDLIMTCGWRFDVPSDTDVIWSWVQPYVERSGQVCFVELIAPLETRLARNETPNRRRHKQTDWSTEEELRRQAVDHRQDSGGAIPFDLPFLRVDTTDLAAAATAELIRGHFALPRVPNTTLA